jgi:hypothetical protein
MYSNADYSQRQIKTVKSSYQTCTSLGDASMTNYKKKIMVTEICDDFKKLSILLKEHLQLNKLGMAELE